MNITYSPWGSVQHQTVKGPGLVAVTTASHGGLYLDEGRWAELRRQLPAFRSWAGDNWLEEDCDACVAVVLWPQLFDAHAVRACYRQCQAMGQPCVKQWLREWGHMAGSICARWETDNYGRWETCGGCTSDGGWISWMEQVGTGAKGSRLFASYPSRAIYTTEQLDAESRPVPADPEPKDLGIRQQLAVAFNENDCGGVFDGVGTVYSDADPGL